jgi:CRISPR-associated protein Cas2
MFVAIACDFGNDDHKRTIHQLLLQYGFKREVENVYESVSITESQLLKLKRELDGKTDAYDSFRFYQYPLKNTMVLSTLKEKKWRKLVMRI